MASAKENTEVVRMLQDFKNAIYKPSPTSKKFLGRKSGLQFSNTGSSVSSSSLSTKLNFSNLDTTKLDMSTSSSSSWLGSAISPDVEGLKRKLATTEVELHATRAAVLGKDAELSSLVPAHKKHCSGLEQKLIENKRQSDIDQETAVRLKHRLEFAQSELKTLKNDALEFEKEKKIEINKLELKILSLKQECSKLKDELAEVKSEKSETVRKLNVEIGRLDLKLLNAVQENSSFHDLVQSLKGQVQDLSEKASITKVLKEQLSEAELKIKGLESKIEANKDNALIVQVKKRELENFSQIENENKLLKEEISKYRDSNVILFQEKMWSLQKKLTQSEQKTVDYAKIKLENEQLKNKLAEWETLFDDSSNLENKSALSFSRQLSQYQKNEALMTNKISTLSSHCETLERNNKSLQVALNDLTMKNKEAAFNSERFDVLKKRLERRIFLLSKERDNCRKLIDSYISETTLSGAMLTNAHVRNLEETIVEYKSSLEKADEDIEQLESQVKVLNENLSVKQKPDSEYIKLQKENEILQSKIGELNIAKMGLELKLTEPRSIPVQSEKIIHLKHNPIDEAYQKRAVDVQTLRDENDRLKKRIKVLEEEGASASDITAKVQVKLEKEGSESQLQTLKEQLNAAETKNKRIIEAARTTSREFREAIYRLLGYKVDIPVTGQYKLSHVYAESRDDFLLFEINNGIVNLMETEYSNNLGERIETYLQGYESFPAFLARVTMDLFNQQTFVAGASDIVT